MQVYRATKDDAMWRSTADSCATTKGDDRRGVGKETETALRGMLHTAFSMQAAMLINGRRLFRFVLAHMQADLAGGQRTRLIVAVAIAIQCTAIVARGHFIILVEDRAMDMYLLLWTTCFANRLYSTCSAEPLALRAAGTTNHDKRLVCLAEVERRGGSQNFCTGTTSHCYQIQTSHCSLYTPSIHSHCTPSKPIHFPS
jgi:hypothetical protein